MRKNIKSTPTIEENQLNFLFVSYAKNFIEQAYPEFLEEYPKANLVEFIFNEERRIREFAAYLVEQLQATIFNEGERELMREEYFSKFN